MKGRSYPEVGWPKARRAQSQAPARANVEPAADFDEEPLAARQARSALADLGDLAGRGGLAVGEAAQRRAESRARSGRRMDGPERFPALRRSAEGWRPLASRSGRAYWDAGSAQPLRDHAAASARRADGVLAAPQRQESRGAAAAPRYRRLPSRRGAAGSRRAFRVPMPPVRRGARRGNPGGARRESAGALRAADPAALRLVHGAAAPHPPRRLGIPERRSRRHRGGTGREAPLEGLARRGTADAAAPSALNSRPAQEASGETERCWPTEGG